MLHARVLTGLVLIASSTATAGGAPVHATDAELSRAHERPAIRVQRVIDLPAPIADAIAGDDAAALVRATVAAYGLEDERVARDLWTGLLLRDEDVATPRDRAARRRVEMLRWAVARCGRNAALLDIVEASIFSSWHWLHLTDPVAEGLRITPRGALWRGFGRAHDGDDVSALALFRLAARDPLLAARAHFAAGRCLVRLCRFDEAIIELEQAHEPDGTPLAWDGLDSSDDLADATSWRALALLRAGRPREAREALGWDDASGANAELNLDEVEMEIIQEALDDEGHHAAARGLRSSASAATALRELKVDRDPFGALVTLSSAVPWNLVGVEAVAALGRRDLAEETLPLFDALCATPLRWSPDCTRLPRVHEGLGIPVSPASSDETFRPSIGSLIPFAHASVPRRHRSPMLERKSDATAIEPPEALRDWRVIRVERSGHRVIALSMYRGDAENVPWTYWVHESNDGGKHFAPPLSLGFTPSWVVVRPASLVPLLDGDVLTLEVLLRESSPKDLDSRELVTRRRADNLLLRIPLADLRRDTDADGLTDLAERTLFLDPARGDTDGDGWGDAVDPSPRAPTRERATVEGAILEAMLGTRLPRKGGEPLRVRHVEGESARRKSQPLAPLELPASDIEFVTGEGVADIAPPADKRWIVLSADEARALAASREYGSPARCVVIFDESRARAIAKWDDHGCMTSATATRSEGTWSITADMGICN